MGAVDVEKLTGLSGKILGGLNLFIDSSILLGYTRTRVRKADVIEASPSYQTPPILADGIYLPLKKEAGPTFPIESTSLVISSSSSGATAT